MKKCTAQLAVILGLLFSSFSCFAQLDFQSEGTRFWIGYMENITLMFNGEPRFSLRVSSEIATTGTIIVPTTNLEIPFEIEAGATEIDLPDAIWYSELSQVVDNKGILIETATPVELAAIHYRIFFTDGSKVLPESSLGTDYMALAVEDLYGVSPSTIVIVATEDDTEIEVTPSVLTEALFPADIPFTFTMNAGQSYQIHADGDLSGSTISSLTGQKIAVYAGAQQAAVGCAPDDSHHWEQIIPTAFWGTEYALIPYRDQSENIFKILAGEDNTNIFIDCELEVTLNAGETYEILTADPLVISSDIPVQVGQLNRGSECNPNEQGPSFAILHPLNHQSTGQSLNFTGGINGLELVSHYVNLVCLENTATEVLLDGNEVNFAPLPQNPNLVYARVSLNQGNHEFVAPSGVWAQAYSFGPYEACTFTLGHDILVNPTDDLSLSASPGPTTDIFCAGTPIEFNYTSDILLSDIAWDFAGLGESNMANPSFEFTEPGIYEILFTATSGDGCPVTSSIIIEVQDCSTSIEENILSTFNIIPSPNATRISTSLDKPFQCLLLSADGKQVLSETGAGQIVLNHAGIASGIYFLQIEMEGEFLSKKLWIRGE